MVFKPNEEFKKDYDRIFKENPRTANMYLLICELADEKGQVKTNEQELADLMMVRFNNPREYAL